MLSNASSRLLRFLAPAAAAAAIAGAPSPVHSQPNCSFQPNRFPASPPPASLWSGLEPTYQVLPSSMLPQGVSRDSSWFQTNGNWGLQNPMWWDLDIEDGYLYTAFSQGFQIWHIGGNPTEPPRLGHKSIHLLAPVLYDQPHDFEIPRAVDAAPGDHTLVALTGDASMGMLLLNATSKANPVAYYQDHGSDPQLGPEKDGEGVYVGAIGGRYYGFLAARSSTVGAFSGVFVYDLTRARELGALTPCVEALPNVVNCPGVGKGKMTDKKTQGVHGVADGSKHFVVFAGGDFSHKGFEIWDVTNPEPSARVQKLTGLTNDVIHGVALWRDAVQNKIFLALANRKTGAGSGARGQIYDVTCIRTSCGSLPSPIYDFPLTGHVAADTSSSVIFSRTGGATGTPYLFYGGGKAANFTDLQSEWLFDVTGISPSNAPAEVLGGNPLNGGAGQLTIQLGGMTLGYFSYYSHCAPDGTNWYAPMSGQVAGSYFYRAGYSILDIHELVDVGPRITVTGDAQGYTGETLSYTAAASGCTPAPTGWSWQLGGTGGTIVGSQTGSSIDVQWSQIGAKTVTAFNNSGCPGADTAPAAVQILDAQPSIGGVTANPTTAPVCTQINFEATNVTGQPPLLFDWTIEEGGNPVPGEEGDTNPFPWDTEGVSPGLYRGRVNVSGPGGSAEMLSPQVTLTALQALPPSGGFSITNDPPALGSVQFHSSVAGATEWRWDFGDGTILQTQNPTLGVNPVHVYDEVNTNPGYLVTLQVRNCVETDFRTSQALTVPITEVQTLEILDFQVRCPHPGGVCETGETANAFHDILGEPTLYEYNWDGVGGFEQSGPNPIIGHVYPQAGTFHPVLRVIQGSQSDTFQALPVTVLPGGPLPTPTISVGGPATLNVGQQGNYTASAANCTPNPSGWNWTTSGGSGSSNSNSIALSWSASGFKTVTATNSACGSAAGSRVTNVTTPGGGDDLEADFTFTPSNPGAGQPVSFDGSPSTGDLIDWEWDFGDGATGNGEQVTHTFAAAGTFSVELTVAEFGQGCPLGICRDTTTKQVVVGDGNGACVEDANTLCLLGDRFKVTAHWHNQSNGETGMAKVYTPFSGDRTGMFWFFRPDNVELIVKSLDATSLPDPAFWFFYGGLSDREYWVDVVDTVTGTPKQYHNVPGTICGVPDTGAFPVPQSEEPVAGGGALGAFGEDDAAFDLGVIAGAGSSGTCTPNGDNLCLLDGRFSIEVDWHDQHNNNDGVGHPILGTDRTGYFWFFNADNVELVAKMINGTSVNGYYWLLWGGLSDVQYTIRVTDTVTGTMKSWENPPGNFCGGAAANAFPAE